MWIFQVNFIQLHKQNKIYFLLPVEDKGILQVRLSSDISSNFLLEYIRIFICLLLLLF